MSTSPYYNPSLNRSRSHRSIFREEFDSEPLYHPSPQSKPPKMGPYHHTSINMTRSTMSSPTPREVRRLASDHDFIYQASPRPKQLGWWAFLAANLSIPAAMCIGTIFSIVAIVYTNSTSKQVLDCPAWATSCPRADDWTIDHLGTVQGIITLLFLIGLVALAYVALAVCEVAVWPLLSRQVFTISELEAYLSTTRGSILSAPRALMATKTVATGVVLACAVLVTLLPLAAAPMVGYAFTPTLVPVQLEGNYSTSNAAITQLYAQTDPPTSVMVDVMAEYNSWATDPSSEPLPEYRDWYTNRETLAQRGSFSGRAIKLQTSVSCQPHPVKQRRRDGLLWNAFETNMTRTRESLSGKNEPAEAESSDVWVRSLPQLTVWVDNFTFVSDHRTTATLVFAAFNGTIQGGEWTPVILGNTTGSSSIACKVDIEAQDDILTVTEPESFAPVNDAAILSSIDTSSNAAINELLLWFTVAPLLVGSSVDGTQPMFFNSTQTNTAVAYTSSTPERNTWSISGIESMIRLSIGALAQVTSTSPSSHSTQTLKSTIKSLKMDPARSLLLIIPPLLILAAGMAISVWNTWVHRREGIPVMRRAGLGEMLKSTQTRYLAELCATDAAKTYLPSETGPVEVRYGVDKDGVVGLARSVRGLNGRRRVDFQNHGAGAAA
ncbi:hypothetical protein V8F33_007512 [Rhypophila sp. PSN 637]